MDCSSCGTRNQPDGKFCEACGAPLAAACPSCGLSITPGARFCRHCGTQIDGETPAAAVGPAAAPSTESAPVAERKLVSVLFADLVGFTTLAEDRDPESTRELLTTYFDTARDAIERHGGTVEKFIGDAVMAVWGTPVAHEDDSERAVRAALELVAEVPRLAPQLQARAGVLSGEAAVTLGATNQGMVAGDLVNTAARLQGVADPGTVLVGESTMRAAERAVVFEAMGDHAVKGKIAPVPAWRAVRVVAARGGQQRTDALEPPFVGRDEELRLLKEQLHASGRDQRARLVSITGPGGIGKSRLVWELEKYIDGVTEDIYWHRGRSPSYGEGITFWALGEMVRRRAGLTEDDDEATSRAAIRVSVEDFIADPDERAVVEPALLTLLGLSDDVAGRDALFPAWRLFFERISERGTTALVFEDLQWADTGLLDFIDHLLDWSKSRPILVVTLARPELFDRRPDWGAGRRAFTSLALDPLANDAVRQLLEGVVPGLPETAVSTIVERAEGMPLYAVETVRTLLAEGKIERDGDVYRPVGDLTTLTVPESLRSLIASRLDALDPADRTLLQNASVLGQVFNPATLSAVLGESEADLEPRLRSLARRELLEIESDPSSPERGQYKFVQALIREVAYGTLAMRDRRSRHLAIARHYEALGDDELAGALASHYVAAFEASSEGPEADAVAAQARIALRAAADRAAALGAHEQAIAHIDRALAITEDPAERADLLERAAVSSSAGIIGDTERYARDALAAREAVADTSGIYRTTALVAMVLIDIGRLDEASEVLAKALEREGKPADKESEVELFAALARAHMRSDRLAQALEAAERALTLAEPLNMTRAIAEAMNNRAAAVGRMGRRREAVALQETAVALAREGGFVSLQLRLLNNLAVAVYDDDPARSTAISEEMVDTARRVGDTLWYIRAATGLAGTYLTELRDLDRCSELLEDAWSRDLVGSDSWSQARGFSIVVDAARGVDVEHVIAEMEATHPTGLSRWWFDSSVGDAMLTLGEYERAAVHLRACLDSGLSEGNASYVQGVLVQALAGMRDRAEARSVTGALGAGVFQGATSQTLHRLCEAACLALDGQPAPAAEGFRLGIDGMRELGARVDVVRWELTALALLPDAPEAATWAAEIRELAEASGAPTFARRLEQLQAGAEVSSSKATTPASEAVAEPQA